MLVHLLFISCWSAYSYCAAQIGAPMRWDHHFIDSYLQEKSVAYAEEMLHRGEMPLMIWDSSIIEKPVM